MSDPTKKDIYEQAQDLGVRGRSSMSKNELERAVARAKTNREGRLVGPPSREPEPRLPSGLWFRDHLLSLILLSLFLVSLIGQFYFQYQQEVHEAVQHGQPPPGVGSSEFLSTFFSSMLENWQSEFLQLVSFVVLATYFIHRGSPQSRDGDDQMKEDIKAIKQKLEA